MFRATVFTTAKNWKQTSGASSGRTEAQTLICLHHGTGFSNSKECAVYTWTLLQPGEECAVYTCNNLDRPQVNYAAAKEKKNCFPKGYMHYDSTYTVFLKRHTCGVGESRSEITRGLGGGYKWGSRKKPCGDGAFFIFFLLFFKRFIYSAFASRLCWVFAAARGLSASLASRGYSLVAVLRLRTCRA